MKGDQVCGRVQWPAHGHSSMDSRLCEIWGLVQQDD